jgi:hypothetical protein
MSNPDSISADQLRTSPRGYKVRSPWMRNLLTFLMVFGPGLIVMEADNDAGAVSTYTHGDLLNLSGVAPVRFASGTKTGKKASIHFRRALPKVPTTVLSRVR